MKALVGAFNQEKALVGAFSVIVQPTTGCGTDGSFYSTSQDTSLHLHTRNSPAAVTAALLANKGQLRVSEAADSLPPTSAVSFLAARPDIPSVVVTNYRDQFTNKSRSK